MPIQHLQAITVALLCALSASRTNAELIIGSGTQTGTTPLFGGLSEISGLAVSRSFLGSLWVHEDSGNPAAFYRLSTGGALQSTITLSGAPNTDWEDMAIGSKPGGGSYLYLGDIGDNGFSRSSGVDIIRVTEPMTSGNATITSDSFRVKRVVYPNGPRNAESLFCDPLTSDLYIITKESPVGVIYRLPASQFEASGASTLEHLGDLNAPLPNPTSADISPDGGYILVRGRTSGGTTAYLFERGAGQTIGQALLGTPRPVTLQSEGQGEAVGWATNSSGFYSISEGNFVPIRFYSVTQTAAPYITADPQSRTNYSGTTATFTVTATNGPLFYRWRKGTQNLSNGGNVSGATSPTLTLTSVGSTEVGDYSVAINNMTGSATSAPATLIVVDHNAPTGVAAFGKISMIRLNWNSYTGATGYNVKCSQTSGGPYTLVGTTATTTYDDAAVTVGVPCYYVVTATTNSAGETEASFEVSATPVTEDFGFDPSSRGWVGINDPTGGGNNFGWSSGTAGVLGAGNEGEMGGIFARSGTIRYYADTDLGGSFSRTNAFSFSGSMRLANEDFDGKFFLGFIDKNDTSDPITLFGIEFDEPSGGTSNPFRAKATVRSGLGGTVSFADMYVTQNTTTSFSVTWTGSPDGSGTLSGDIGGTPFSISAAAASEAVNAFGVCVGFLSDNPALNTGNCYFDNLVYSVIPSATFTVTGGGAYCLGGSGVAVGLSGSQSGVNYQLYLDGATAVGSPVGGTGSALNFGNQTVAGTYTVKGARTDCTTGCTLDMSGSSVVTVNAPATVDAGADQTVCASSPAVILAGVVGGAAANGTWSGGAGTFTPNNTTLNATYTRTAGEIEAGSVTLTLTTDDPAGPCGAATDTMVITIGPALGQVTIGSILGTTLTYSGGSGSKFILLKSANVEAPLSGWSREATNTVTPGSFTIPEVGTDAPVFYSIQSE